MLRLKKPEGDGPELQIARIRALEDYAEYLSGYIEGVTINLESVLAEIRQRITVLENQSLGDIAFNTLLKGNPDETDL